ncbi:MOSC domain-containing protein [Litoreibacter roseus]|uniref:Molybdenum cofactor biosynthesis protein n=1 Tax=Litoreibacter roseus TaxID=2601869 RepID=A0A6N6JFM1_9RHOB|nr:MOSC N-terminal beta barrel domain-containing protein [Litoreibacter roseus]GFE65153.1 molybdenum cofactor biosynthesis protein [Litoreibacter roseus]
MITVAHLWRHPIKSHGREEVQSVELTEGATFPWDRTWAVTHAGSRTDGRAWAPCANFSRVSKAPELMAITATLDTPTRTVTLRHPKRTDLTFRPDEEPDLLLDWVKDLMPENRAQSCGLVSVPGRGMTDSDYPTISINTLASHNAVSKKAGKTLEKERWRGNIWLSGTEAWEESNWIGKTLRLGNAEIEVREPIERCMATTANPQTGERDIDTLALLQSWGHQNFGVYGVVSKTGTIHAGDSVAVL